jgi:S-DNA-T family DNA segregation ATPase FtsK/SpoIIIE
MAPSPKAKKNNSRKIKTSPSAAPSPPRSRRLGQEMTAVLLLGLAVFLLLSLWTWTLKDPQDLAGVWSAVRVHNWGGKAGAYLSRHLLAALGLAAFWLPLLVAGLAWKSYRSGLDDLSLKQGVALGGMVAASAGLLALAWPLVRWGDWGFQSGGWVGVLLAWGLPRLLNPSGAALALGLVLLISIMGATRLSYLGLLSLIGRMFSSLGSLVWRRRREPEPPLPRSRRPAPAKPLVNRSGSAAPEVVIGPGPTPAPEAAAMAPKTRRASGPGGFTLPPLDLLDQVPPWDQQVHEGAMVAQAEKLEDTLRHFGVEGKVVSITTGPVVSRFELEPAPGVKISKVTGLADDLALALKALSIRIVAPVPGKAVIGIEVPNPKRQVVGLREILADAAYRKSPSRLTIALGKDIMGQSVVNDLAKMPHLLIAGATGSGKSVGLNAMILSILFKATPREVRFLLIDPKRIELSTYEGIPHLLHPVVVNPKEATVALHWAVAEMERRYALLSDLGVRNIEGYNQKIAKNAKEKPPAGEEPPRPLPYIVIVIDELADLMLVSSRDTEEYLIRLAQKARASGMHLLVATQRPSVDVITGLIKANFPTRVSYQVSAKPDSRVILDTVGAERLLGMGDLLFLPPGTSRLKRIHGAFVSDEEVGRVVEFLKAQQSPEFEPGILEMQEKEVEEGEMGEKDEKWDAAVELVAETRNASISMLQRRLRIGYNRAARIIETMENEGLIGPSDGLKAREVYIPRR